MSLFHFHFEGHIHWIQNLELAGIFFFFQHLKMSCQCHLGTISDEKLVVIFTVVSWYEICPLSYPIKPTFAFNISFLFVFSNLTIIH